MIHKFMEAINWKTRFWCALKKKLYPSFFLSYEHQNGKGAQLKYARIRCYTEQLMLFCEFSFLFDRKGKDYPVHKHNTLFIIDKNSEIVWNSKKKKNQRIDNGNDNVFLNWRVKGNGWLHSCVCIVFC